MNSFNYGCRQSQLLLLRIYRSTYVSKHLFMILHFHDNLDRLLSTHGHFFGKTDGRNSELTEVINKRLAIHSFVEDAQRVGSLDTRCIPCSLYCL